MELYFYTLDTYGESPKGLCVKKCEAEEKPKTYKSVDRVFPNHLSIARKDDVGRITNFNSLFLTEPNFEYAKEVFRNRTERRIAHKLKEVEELKAELKIINESEA